MKHSENKEAKKLRKKVGESRWLRGISNQIPHSLVLSEYLVNPEKMVAVKVFQSELRVRSSVLLEETRSWNVRPCEKSGKI